MAKPRSLSGSRAVPLISYLLAWHFLASADTLRVTQLKPNGAPNGVRTVAITDGASKGICAEGVDASGMVVAYRCGITDNRGALQLDLSGVDTANWLNLRFQAGSGETWEGITKEGAYRSEQQKDRDKVPGSYQDRLDGLPFEFLPNLWSDADEKFAQIDITNTSTVYAYSFTFLRLYKGLSPVYWQTDQFDSSAALATGSFQWDFVFDNGSASILQAGGAVEPLLSFPLGAPSYPSYDLLTGVARPILAPGVYGDPMSFSTGVRAVPEPSTLALVVLGTVVLACTKRLMN